MSSINNIQKKILEIILQINPYVDVEIDTKLIEEKIIDSLGIMVLIEELENEFNITISDDDINIERFKSISSIEEVILKTRRI